MKDAMKREDVCKHGKDPGDSVQVWNETDSVQMVEQKWIVEGLDSQNVCFFFKKMYFKAIQPKT
jgi:hypothetical protein